jgi:fumarate reductase flavoprotein subunit
MSIKPAHALSAEWHIPIVIIGGGAAGLIAALAAREEGAEVLVLERDHTPSGSTALSAGLVPAAGTRWQRAQGIADSPERFAADIMAKAHDEPDPAMVELFSRRSGQVLEWLADRHGLAFSVITDFTYPGHSAYRMHGLQQRHGVELMDQLRMAAEAAGIEILCDAHVTQLFARADGHVAGVLYQRPDGTQESVGCDRLVLACNGYGGNPALVARHVPELAGALYFGHPGNQGDALLWGTALGAASRHLSGHQGHGSVARPIGILISWATITAGGVQVNQHGERFSDETQGYSEQAAVVLRQPGGIAWTVFDTRIAAIAAQFEDFRQAQAQGAILHDADLGSLANRMQVPADALRRSVAHSNGLAPDPFGRDFTATPPLAAPYCAVRVTGALFHTQGGLVVDCRARVLREDGTALPNLLAAGGAACGVSGGEARGYLSGNGLLSAVALGYVAGKEAVLF